MNSNVSIPRHTEGDVCKRALFTRDCPRHHSYRVQYVRLFPSPSVDRSNRISRTSHLEDLGALQWAKRDVEQTRPIPRVMSDVLTNTRDVHATFRDLVNFPSTYIYGD